MDAVIPGVLVLTPGLLVANWLIGDQERMTKLILIAVYLLTWMLLFVGWWAVSGAQAILCMVLGFMTFGIDWMMGR